MKPGQASKTAVMVCMARAAAHERMRDVHFSDPRATRRMKHLRMVTADKHD